jgi:MYXO-CTERM domain-containing protein
LINVSNNSVLVWSGTNNTDDISTRLQVPANATAKLNMGSSVVEFASAPTMGTGASLSVTSGTLKVTAAASGLNFTGTTGTLSINGTVGSVGLSTGGTLGGSGTVGAVTTATGSHLSPGNSPGTLNMASLTLAAGTIIDWQVQDALDFTGPELGFDTIHITGNLDVTAVTNSSQRIVIKVASLLGNGNGTTLGAPLNFNNADTPGMMPRTFDFMRVDGAISFATGKSISDIFTFNLNDFVYTNGGSNNYGLWSVSSYASGGDTYIRITAVPEPSTYGFALGALALAAAAIRRRRKNQPKA